MEDEEQCKIGRREISRREFLRLMGAGAAVVALGGLGGVAGCSFSGGSATTQPAGATATTAPATTSTSVRPLGPTTTEGAPRRGGTLRVGALGSIPQRVEPNAFPVHMTSGIIMHSLFDTLVRPKRGVGTFQWEMALAEAVSMESPSTWTVRLREGATWHDGRPVTVDDLVFSIRRALDPGTFVSHLLLTIDRDNIEKGRDAAGRTVRLHLTSPDSMLIDSLASIFIVPVDYDPARPVGTGPYKMGGLAPGECRLLRNDGYWGGSPYPDEIAVRPFITDAERAEALITGHVDAATAMDVTRADQLKATGSVRTLAYTSPMTYSLDMNVDWSPLSDVRVRQACRILADRRALVERVFAGRAQVSNDLPCPADANFASDLPVPAYDPEKARALLQQAGQAAAQIRLSASPLAPGLRELAVAYAEQATAAGLRMAVEEVAADGYYGDAYAGRPMSTSFWLPQPLAVQVALTRLPESRFNPSRFADEVYAHKFAQARAERNPQTRKEILREMQFVDYERGPAVIPVTPHVLDVYSPRVGGAEPLPLHTYPNVRGLWLSS